MSYLNAVKRHAVKGRIHELYGNMGATIAVCRRAYATPESVRNALNAMRVAYRCCRALRQAYPRAGDALQAAYLETVEAAKMRRENNVLEPKLKERMFDFADVLDAARAAEGDTIHDSMDRIILLFVALQYPKRSDLGACAIVAGDGVGKGNYVVVPKKGACVLVMNDYKTSKKYGEYREELDAELGREIRASLDRFPREYLLVQARDTTRPLTRDGYSKRVASTFMKHLGVPVRPGDIRHLYIFNKARESTYGERVEMASGMLHSFTMQAKYDRVDRP